MGTLIVSDLHLGSRNCQATCISRILETDFDRLILNGDIINSVNMKKLTPEHWGILHRLRELARERELILIRGNHEGAGSPANTLGQLDVLPSLLGMPLREEYQLEVGGRQYLVLHGDRFDPTLNAPIVTDAADWCYQAVQKVNRRAAKWLKRRAKQFGGVVAMVQRRSIAHALSLGCRGVIAGHTHFADDEWIDGVHYLNSGCWVDRPCTYILATDDQPRLCHWDESEHNGRRTSRVYADSEAFLSRKQIANQIVE